MALVHVDNNIVYLKILEVLIMNVLICDDMKSETEKLVNLLNDSGININATIFHNGYDALDYVHSNAAVDVCFLDIVMPDMSGVVLAEKLRVDGFTGEIVFLTNSNEYAVESYAVDAFSYLLKPPTVGSVQSVFNKLENARKSSDTGGILVKMTGISKFILFCDLSHVEVIKHKVYFRLTNQDEAETYATFGEIVPGLLSDKRFIQCHRSFVVNMSYIVAINGREITMRNGARIPISRSYPDVKKKYLQWMFGGDRKRL